MSNIKLFESQKIRSHWDAEKEKWLFSVVDVIAALTESNNPQVYWRVLKKRLLEEGNETVTNCNALKMQAADGKMRITDVVDTEQLLRLIQSIPSPKAEPFKQWLAKVGYERIEETQDPEKSIDRAMENYMKLGYSKENLRDNMTNLELVLNMLAEATTTEISKEKKPATLDENREVARQGGTVAGNTRKEIESKTGKKIVSPQNAKGLKPPPETKNLE